MACSSTKALDQSVVVYSSQVGRGHDVAYVKIKTAVGTSAAH